MTYAILITGANGFIGSHTTLLMESLGHNVIPVDVVPRSADLSLLERSAIERRRHIYFTRRIHRATKLPRC